jgi:hypothetical protein
MCLPLVVIGLDALDAFLQPSREPASHTLLLLLLSLLGVELGKQRWAGGRGPARGGAMAACGAPALHRSWPPPCSCATP